MQIMGKVLIFQVLITFWVVCQTSATNSTCNTTEVQLSSLINATLNVTQLPSDLATFTSRLSNSNTTLRLYNCSEVLTLKLYLHNQITALFTYSLLKHHCVALLAYVEFQEIIRKDLKYVVPSTQGGIQSLIDTFASTNLNPYLEQKVVQFFSLFNNWIGTLNKGNFPFHMYDNPRRLLLDMICALIQNSTHQMYEREAILFLVANKHSCSFLTISEDPYINRTMDGLIPPLINHQDDNRTLDDNRSNSSSFPYEISLPQNVTAAVLNNKMFPNHNFEKFNLFLNISVINIIKLKRVMQDENSTRKGIALVTMSKSQETLDNVSAMVQTRNKSTGVKDQGSKNMKTLKEERLGEVFVVRSQQEGRKLVEGLTVWDVVELEGPCKEGQQHVVKLNPQSILTAIDKGASDASLELFLSLLPDVEGFPIEDYNARGQLLRDLLPEMGKKQADPTIRQKLEELLDHVLLDGPGALPPKIKLECGDLSEKVINKTPRSRRTRHIFSFQYY